jgi:signal transduction histidine kinase
VLRSLRFKLPALFLAGVVLAGLVATAIAATLFQDHARAQSFAELRREAAGLTDLYAEQARKTSDEGQLPPAFAAPNLEKATGDRLFYAGVNPFPGEESGLRPLPRTAVDWAAIQDGRVVEFEFTPWRFRPRGRALKDWPRSLDRTFLAVAQPFRVERRGPIFGALVVAKPKREIRAELLTALERLAIALLVGIAVAGALAAYLSRRLTRPVLALSRAADEVAEGRYGVALPSTTGADEISHLAERFREMAERLQEAEELERNFLMTVSHELRTPLTAIRGHVEALREGVVAGESARQASLEVISEEAARLERLVGDVLDLAKLGSRRFTVLREEVDMGRLLDRAYAAFGEEARRRRIDYEQNVSARPVVTSDGDRVLQIISNLLANAFRWTPDGGRIELSLASANGGVRVAVSDTGPGISAEEQERIFRPFWSRDGGGTGLGLAIARELALALGGRIDLDTEPGKGSRFELILPTRPG